MIPVRSLSRFVQPRGSAPPDGCGFCGVALAPQHRHVVDLEERSLRCACRACSLLFDRAAACAGRLRTVPERVVYDEAFRLGEADWAPLEIPVRLAFVFFNSRAGRWVASYPSPAGATESALALGAWEKIARAPLVASMEPDVEALLVYGRRPSSPLECLVVPVDACYELVGRIRRAWRGIDGGGEVPRQIEDCLARLRGRARELRGPGGPKDAST